MFFRSRSASAENEQNDAGRCGCRGIASFCRSGGIACESGQNNCSPWFCSFCRVKAAPMAMGPGCAQRSLSAASLFGYFCGEKVTGPARPRARRCKSNTNEARYQPVGDCFIPYSNDVNADVILPSEATGFKSLSMTAVLNYAKSDLFQEPIEQVLYTGFRLSILGPK